MDSIMSSATTCLSQTSSSRTVLFGDALYVTTSPEGAVRLEQLARLANPEWQGSVIAAQDSAQEFLSPNTSHAIVVDESALPEGRFGEAVCHSRSTTMYALAPMTANSQL